VITAAAALDWFAQGIVASPITGPAGNHEYVLWLGANRTAPEFDLKGLVTTTLQSGVK
jgi:23S rRNA (cytidine1920-2'-O)/16S rRNA (cytidine1409-2'-O)-methyltransferase